MGMYDSSSGMYTNVLWQLWVRNHKQESYICKNKWALHYVGYLTFSYVHNYYKSRLWLHSLLPYIKN